MSLFSSFSYQHPIRSKLVFVPSVESGPELRFQGSTVTRSLSPSWSAASWFLVLYLGVTLLVFVFSIPDLQRRDVWLDLLTGQTGRDVLGEGNIWRCSQRTSPDVLFLVTAATEQNKGVCRLPGGYTHPHVHGGRAQACSWVQVFWQCRDETDVRVLVELQQLLPTFVCL